MRSSGAVCKLLAIPQSWRGRNILRHIMLCLADPRCEACVKSKRTQEHSTKDSDNQANWQSKNSDGPRIHSDFFHMSEAGVATPMLAVIFSQMRQDSCHRRWMAGQALTQYGVKFFAGSDSSRLEFEGSSTRRPDGPHRP